MKPDNRTPIQPIQTTPPSTTPINGPIPQSTTTPPAVQSAATQPQVAVVLPGVIQPIAQQQPPANTPLAQPQDSSTFYQSAIAPTAPAAPQVFTGGGGLVEPSKAKKGKLPFIIAGAAASVLLIVAGGVFGLYLPNTEANVWQTGLNRSGDAFDKIVVDATEAKKLETYKTTAMKGTLTADFKDGSLNGDMNFTFDKKYSDSNASFTLKSDGEGVSSSQTLSGKVMTEIPEGSNFPNIYFQFSGLKEMGLDFWFPGASDYENKWMLADASYLETLGVTYMTGTTQDEKQVTAEDIAEAARAASKITSEYALTADPNKAIFVKKEFVNKERVDGLNTYHYKVGINTAHAIDYCEALTSAMLDTNAYKKLSGNDNDKIKEEKKDIRKDCEEQVKNADIKESDTFDMWIDKKYKLIHKIRIYEKDDKGTYTDIGQTYKGGDRLSLFVAYHDTKGNSDGKFIMETNLKTNKTMGELTYSSRNVDSPLDMKLTMESVLSGNPVSIEKPSSAIPIQEMIQKMDAGHQNPYDTSYGEEM
jgi:hypothetical protein